VVKIDNICSSFDTKHEFDRQETNRQAYQVATMYCACLASRGKNDFFGDKRDLYC